MRKFGTYAILIYFLIPATFLLFNCGGGGGSGDSVAPIALVSVSSGGDEGNVESDEPVLSFNGRYVAFYTDSSNLVSDDTNGTTDVFIRDMDLGITSRVSVSTAGSGGNTYSSDAAISFDGRYVVFYSGATNLVPGDNNNSADIFLRDTVDEITSLVTVSTAGTLANNNSGDPAISGDGRHVAFYSPATNLVQDDINGHDDIFVHNTVSGITSLVSVSTAGTQGNNDSYDPAMSSDGRYVAFTSDSTNLVPNDTNAPLRDIFVRDTVNEITSLVSVSTAGTQTNDYSINPTINSDGRYVAFQSAAWNLVPNDNNNSTDIFIHDTATSTTSRVSVNSAGEEANSDSEFPTISSDGRYVAFYSYATNLVPDDNNNSKDVFVHDTVTGTTSRASLSTTGEEIKEGEYPSISPDGRYVAFKSNAVDLIEGETLSGIGHLFRAPRP